MNKIAVIYHISCPDGTGAAWVAWRKFGGHADYFPVSPRALPEQSLDDYSEIYVLDNSFTEETIKRFTNAGRRVTVIDHHESSLADIKLASEYVFDKKHSAAVLTWNYFYPKKKVPKFLKYVEAGDLWLDKLPKAEEIRAFISAIPLEFSEFSKLVKLFESTAGFRKIAAEGKTMLKYRDLLVRQIAKRAYHVEFLGYIVLAINSSFFNSDLGGYLAEIHPPFGIIWY